MEPVNVFHVSSAEFVDCKVSKAEMLRGMIAEKLTTAAQEILAVVERTVAGYEEEASGFRQEIDRQKRQLEVLLQPQVKVCRIDDDGLIPVCEEDKLPEEEEQQTFLQTDLEDSRNQEVLHHTMKDEADAAAGEPAQRTRPDRQDQTSNTRLQGQSVKRRRLGSLKLRVCLLKDSVTNVRGRSSQETRSSMQEVRCPRGLQEADFLDLLRSKFPELTGRRFDVFTSDTSKKLLPLAIRALTPEEIQRSIQSTGRGRSGLYVRAKVGDEERTCEEDRGHDNTADSLTRTSDDAMKHTSDPVSRVEIKTEDAVLPGTSIIQLIKTEDDDVEGGTSLDATSDPPANPENHVDDDGDETFTTNKSLISEEPLRPPSSAFTGSDESSHIVADSRRQQKETEDGREDCGISEPDKFSAVSSACPSAESKGGNDDDDDDEEEEAMVDHRDSDWTQDESDEELEESEPEPNSSKTARKPQVKRSGVKTNRSKRTKVSSENGDAPLSCKVCAFLFMTPNGLAKHAWSHVDDPETVCGVCGVCGEHSESAEELRSHLQSHQKIHSCNVCGKSFVTRYSLKIHANLHTAKRRYKCDVCHKAYIRKSSLHNHRWKHVEDKPHKCDVCRQSFGVQQQLRIHMRCHTGEKPYRCKECGKFLCNFYSLRQHMLRHTREKRYACQVCGERFLLLEILKRHEKTYADRAHVCHVCRKTFHGLSKLKAHLKSHKRERSHERGEGGERMPSRGVLKKR